MSDRPIPRDSQRLRDKDSHDDLHLADWNQRERLFGSASESSNPCQSFLSLVDDVPVPGL